MSSPDLSLAHSLILISSLVGWGSCLQNLDYWSCSKCLWLHILVHPRVNLLHKIFAEWKHFELQYHKSSLHQQTVVQLPLLWCLYSCEYTDTLRINDLHPHEEPLQMSICVFEVSCHEWDWLLQRTSRQLLLGWVLPWMHLDFQIIGSLWFFHRL